MNPKLTKCLPEQPPLRRRNFFGRLGALGATAVLAATVKAGASGGAGRRLMLNELKHEHFAGLVGQPFTIRHEGGSLAVTLAEAKSLGTSPRAGLRDPFSLIFWSEERGHLPQQIYAVTHATLGAHEVFLVPLGPDPQRQGMRYQAVFA